MLYYARGDVIRSEIAKRNITQAAFARMIGTTPPVLSHLLSGRKTIGPDLRQRIMGILKLGFEDLFETVEREPARR